MNPRMLFDYFERLADAPDAIPKLRATILQLAVQGKLMPQDPDDEPASVLLEKIVAEKERLIKEGKIKKTEPLPPIGADEIPYEVPEGWVWTRIRQVTHDLGQRIPEKPFTYIDVTTVDKDRGQISESPVVLDPDQAPSRARKLIREGSVIYSTVRPYLLNLAIVDKEFKPQPIVSTAFAVLHPFPGCYNKFLYHYLRSIPFTQYVSAQMTGMAYPAINDFKMALGPFPLPPLPEQKRIVVKVDQLMVLCDALDERKKRRDEGRVNLNAACLHELTSPEPQKFRKAWKRIQSHFDLLYDTPANVAALRKSILQLAVMGRLAPQDPSDEPASVLLEKIAAEKEQLIKEGKIKKGKPLPPIRPDEVPYEVPEGWEWAMLGDLGITQTGTTPSKSHPEYSGNYIPFIKPADITQNGIFYGNEGLSIRGMEKGRLIEKNSVLMVCIGGSIGKANLTDRDCSCNQQINAITPYSCISYEFLHFLMRSPYFQNEVLTRAPKSTLPILSKSKWERIPIAIPPLPEQKRIVAKVDRLMTLCGQLEGQLGQSQMDCDALLSAILNQVESVS